MDCCWRLSPSQQSPDLHTVDCFPFLLKYHKRREEHSMDQYRSRLKVSENFERHWSIPFPGKFVWTNCPESSSKVSPYTGIGPWMALPRNGGVHEEDVCKCKTDAKKRARTKTDAASALLDKELQNADKHVQRKCEVRPEHRQNPRATHIHLSAPLFVATTVF